MLDQFSLKHLASICLPIVAASLPFSALAAEGPYEIEVRANVLLGDGVPANDILGFGVAGRYYLKDRWFVSGAIEAYDYDFEHPVNVVGLLQDPNVKTIDASVSTTVISAGIGRTYDFSLEKFDWFWELGLGAGFPDVDNASGPLSTGGTFTLATDASTEFHLLGKLGASYHFTPNWTASFVARLEHHFMDFKVTEMGTGATGTVDSQTPMGAHLALSYSF